MMYHPDTNGITWNGAHSRTDYGAVTKERSKPPPVPIVRQERVPYSNLIWDFSGLCGVAEYEMRTLRYVFTISDPNHARCRRKVDMFLAWLYSRTGYADLYDSTDEGFHYSARLKSAVPQYTNGVYCEITVEFEAKPEVISHV
jgi:hypothetical protein